MISCLRFICLTQECSPCIKNHLHHVSYKIQLILIQQTITTPFPVSGVGVSVGHVTAEDRDLGSSAAVTYTILSHWGRDKFSLNSGTGILTLIGNLDYEQVRGEKSSSPTEKQFSYKENSSPTKKIVPRTRKQFPD